MRRSTEARVAKLSISSSLVGHLIKKDGDFVHKCLKVRVRYSTYAYKTIVGLQTEEGKMAALCQRKENF